jgi:Na+-driven multidrug efflux pump
MGFVLQAVGAGLSNFIRTDGSPSYALVVMIVGTVVSCVFNWLFVMQLGWGMTGSALATVLGQLTTTVLVLQYFFSKRAQMRITRAGLVPDAKLIGTIAMLGLSTFVVQVASSLTSSILNLQITALGPTDPVGVDGGLAVIGTVNKVIQVLLFVILGFSVAAQPILGFNYGAQNYRRVRKALWTTVGVALVVNFVLWLLCRIFCDQIMTFFGLTSDMHEFASSTLMFMTLAFPIVPLQIIGSNYFQATGQPLKATILTLTRQIIFYLPCLFIIPTVLPGLTGMTPLACLPAAVSTADILAIIVTGVFVVREMGRLDRLQAAHDARVAADAKQPVNVGRDVR